MQKWELIQQGKPLKIKRKMLSNLFNGKYGLKLGKFNNTTGTERVKQKTAFSTQQLTYLKSYLEHMFLL